MVRIKNCTVHFYVFIFWFQGYHQWPLHNIRLNNMCRGMDRLKEFDLDNENDKNGKNASALAGGNSLCFDSDFVESLCKLHQIKIIKTVRYLSTSCLVKEITKWPRMSEF